MTVRNIYDCALRLIGEKTGTCGEGEMEERAPYIAAALCGEASALDRAYRSAFGLGTQAETSDIILPLDAEFPLCDRFAPAAAFYMGAMLILDGNGELYETLFERWCDALAGISSELPFLGSAVTDVYGSY